MFETGEHLNAPLSRRTFLAGSLLAATGLLTLDACSTEPTKSLPEKSLPKGTIDFFGNLPDGPLKSSYWHYITDPEVAGYNEEAQEYTDTHATIKDGQLTIEAVKTAPHKIADGTIKEYESSRIESQGQFNFTHGTLTATAMLPEGVGTWPAVWLLPEDAATPSVLKRSGIKRHSDNDKFDYAWGGEIDFLETVGALDTVSNIPAIHTHSGLTLAKGGDDDPKATEYAIADGQKAFHEYAIHKEPGLLQFTVDGKVIRELHRQKKDTVDQWPFDDYKYFIIANLAMGGSWGGMKKDAFPPYGIDDSKGPWEFSVKKLIYEPLT